jgi:hypothetical protein
MPAVFQSPKASLKIFYYVCELFGAVTPHSHHFPAFRDNLCGKCALKRYVNFQKDLKISLLSCGTDSARSSFSSFSFRFPSPFLSMAGVSSAQTGAGMLVGLFI